MIYGMIDTELLEKYIQKYERYADYANTVAESIQRDIGDDIEAAESYGYNRGEADAYRYVARDLRAMLNGIVDEG